MKSEASLKKNWPLLLGAAALTAGIRIIVWHFFKNLPVSSDWTQYYGPAAQTLMTAKNFFTSLSALDIAPLYIVYLSLFYQWLGNTLFAMRLSHLVLESLIAALLYITGEKIFNKTTAVIAVLFYALYPIVIYMAGLGQPETLLTLWLLIIFNLWHGAATRASLPCYFVLGIFLAGSLLIKPNYIGFLPFWILWEMLFSAQKKNALRIFLPVSCGFVSLAVLWKFFQSIFQPISNASSMLYVHIVYCGSRLRPSLADGSLADLKLFYDQQMQTAHQLLGTALPQASDLLALTFKNWGNLFWPNPLEFVVFLAVKFHQIWFATAAGHMDRYLRYLQIPLVILIFWGIICLRRDAAVRLKQRPMFLVLTYTVLALMAVTPLHREMLPVLPVCFLYAAYGFHFLFRGHRPGINNISKGSVI